MKILFLIAALCFNFSTINLANTNPTDLNNVNTILLKNESVTCSVTISSATLISVNYSADQSELYYETKSPVRLLQVIKGEKELVYQIPIGGSKVHLSLKDFDEGVYSLNFLLQDSDTIVSTTLTKK